MRSNSGRMEACRTVLEILCLAAVFILNSEAAIKAWDGTSSPNVTAASVSTQTTILVPRSSTTHKPQQPAEVTTMSPKKVSQQESSPEARKNEAVAATSTADLDGRSAYVNNKYIPDEPLADEDNSPPLYQFLQQQMEQMLASTGSEVSGYVDDNTAPAQKEALGDVLQYGLTKPSYPYAVSSFKHYDDASDNVASAKEQEKIFHAYTTKPGATQELPRPIATTSAQHNARPTKASVATSPSQMQPSYADSQPTPLSMSMQQLDTKNAYLMRNSTIHMRKRRITFKTVSSASQIIATPLADLMFKFSIGIAEPLMSTAISTKSMVGHDANEDTESGYTGNLDLPQRNRPMVKKAGIRKN